MINLYNVLSLCCSSLANRVGENWPLYDILNQFQKGQSHMAIVVKCEENIRTAATDPQGKTPSLSYIMIHIQNQYQQVAKLGSHREFEHVTRQLSYFS